jgi:hypothetical protein
MTILFKKLWRPTKRTILMVSVANELWTTTSANGDQLTHWYSFGRVIEANHPGSRLWQLVLLGVHVGFTKF